MDGSYPDPDPAAVQRYLACVRTESLGMRAEYEECVSMEFQGMLRAEYRRSSRKKEKTEPVGR